MSLVDIRKFHRTMTLDNWKSIVDDTIYARDAETFWRLGLLNVISEYGADSDLLILIESKLKGVKPW